MAQKHEGRKKEISGIVRRQIRQRRRNIFASFLYGIITFVLVTFIVLTEIKPTTYSITVGEAAETTVYAISEAEDTDATKYEKNKARDAVGQIYAVDSDVTQEEKSFFQNTVFKGFSTVAAYGYSVRSGADSDGFQVAYDTQKVRSFADNELSFLKASDTLIDEKVKIILNSNPNDIKQLRDWFLTRLDGILTTGVNESNIDTVRASFAAEILLNEVISDTQLSELLANVAEEKLYINSFPDDAATEKARVAAENAVPTVYISKGTAIVTEDEIVTQAQYDILEKMGMVENGGIPYRLYLSAAATVLIFFGLLIWYICFFNKKGVSAKRVLLLCLLALLNVVLAIAFKSAGWTMMMNSTMCVVLAAVFFDELLAQNVNIVLSVVLALIASGENDVLGVDSIALLISSFGGGLAAIIVCRRVKDASRVKLLSTGIASGCIGMMLMFSVLALFGKKLDYALETSLYALAGGAVAALIGMGSISVWESVFNLLTPAKLMELSDSGSDLLRKISIEIPGTYQHSTAVAEMAENAAKNIGANASFARCAALYHDIGKLRTPECYTENQNAETKNFHATLSPYESAAMIFSHITEGVQLARANKLPEEIIDVIRQHHGTSAVMYFYNAAKQQNPDTNIDDFRYPGPNPQTKEAGIILLADCVEASVRSLDNKDTENIRAQIERMFKARMEDGELDDCELSLKDLNRIKSSFASTLSAMYHTRIKYQNTDDEKKGKKKK